MADTAPLATKGSCHLATSPLSLNTFPAVCILLVFKTKWTEQNLDPDTTALTTQTQSEELQQAAVYTHSKQVSVPANVFKGGGASVC